MVLPIYEASLPQVSCPPGQLFPNTADILQNDPLADCMRVGVGTTIIDDEGRILMLAHRGADGKCQPGALGPLTETVQWIPQGNTYQPEATLQTVARAVREELGRDPEEMRFRAQRYGAWFLDKVPLGGKQQGQFILGIGIVVHTSTESAEELVDTFESSPEITRLLLMQRKEIDAHHNIRSEAAAFLKGIFRRSLHIRPREELVEFSLPPVPSSQPNSSDNIPRHLKIVA